MIPSIPSAQQLIPVAIMFSFVMTRLAVMFMTAPLLEAKTFPTRNKVAVVAVISFAVFMALPSTEAPELEISTITLALLGEIAVGAAAGLAAQLVFGAVETAGQLLGLPMGLGFANAVDPLTQVNSVITSRFMVIIAAFVFLALDIHHVLIKLIAQSFIVLPPGQAGLGPAVGYTLVEKAGMMFTGAVQLAAPVMLVLLGTMMVLGLLAKIAPKVNLFVLSFAISIALGLIALRGALPDMTVWIRDAVSRIGPLATEVLQQF